MRKVITISLIVVMLFCVMNANAQSGSIGYIYPDSVEVVEVIGVDAIKAVDSKTDEGTTITKVALVDDYIVYNQNIRR